MKENEKREGEGEREGEGGKRKRCWGGKKGVRRGGREERERTVPLRKATMRDYARSRIRLEIGQSMTYLRCLQIGFSRNYVCHTRQTMHGLINTTR